VLDVPNLASADWAAIGLTAAAMLAPFRFAMPIGWVCKATKAHLQVDVAKDSIFTHDARCASVAELRTQLAGPNGRQ
jgi:hypothetical protein